MPSWSNLKEYNKQKEGNLLMNDSIPCKDCLVYALCKHKEKIVCSLLYGWMRNGTGKYEEINYLPNWGSIEPEGEPWNRRHRFVRSKVRRSNP